MPCWFLFLTVKVDFVPDVKETERTRWAETLHVVLVLLVPLISIFKTKQQEILLSKFKVKSTEYFRTKSLNYLSACSRNLLDEICTEKAEATSFNAVTMYMWTLVEDHASGRWGKTKRESILHHTRLCFWLLLYHRVLLLYRYEQKSGRIISLNWRRRRGGRWRRLWTRYILLCFGYMDYFQVICMFCCCL